MAYPDDDNLTTLSKLRGWLRLAVDRTEADTDLQELIVRVSGSLVDAVERKKCMSGPVTETRSGTGRSKMVFAVTPVTAVTSVVVDGVSYGLSPDDTVVGYRFDENSVVLIGAAFNLGVNNVTLSYVGGWAANSKEQRMLEQACLEWASFIWRSRDRVGVTAQSKSRDIYEKLDVEAMPPNVRRTVQRLRNVVPLR